MKIHPVTVTSSNTRRKKITDVSGSPVRVDGIKKKKRKQKEEIERKDFRRTMSAVMSGRQDEYITNMQS